uniref:Cell death regulator Aven n=2 Tax=Ceratitis capitata TaxID=7213 RepID=W8C895_CERCA
MEGKDNRSKDKRSKMKQYRKKAPVQHNNNTSSSSQVEVMRGIVDVADSSDERFVSRRGWATSRPQPQIRRYSLDDEENDLNEAESAQMNAGDFGLMSQLPTSVGGHFQFSSEKNWDSVDTEQFLDNTEASQYFTLNLKLLNVGLQTIPFYKRMDYAASLFTRDQLRTMENAAEAAEKNYQKVLHEHETNPSIKINSGSRKSGSGRSQNSLKPNNVEASETNVGDELDELLNLTTAAVTKVDISVGNGSGAENAAVPIPADSENVSAHKDDIQEWLDNVLEE